MECCSKLCLGGENRELHSWKSRLKRRAASLHFEEKPLFFIKGEIRNIFSLLNYKISHQKLREHAALKYWILQQQQFSHHVLL